MTYSINIVANYILQKTGEIDTVKLQKLAYYCQACSLAWDNKALIKENFEAWALGPVCPELDEMHEDLSMVSVDNFPLTAEEKNISFDQDIIDTIDVILDAYGDMEGYELSNLTHLEDPWIKARGDAEPLEHCDEVISKNVMRKYYNQ